MASLEKDLMFLILQFLGEKKHKDIVHRLESESGCYFDMRYFEELVTQGKWDEMEKYLSGFTKIWDNLQSTQIFFEIQKHKYLEALDKRDHAKALEIFFKDLKVFELETSNKDLFKEMSLLLTMDDFRANPNLSTYGDTTSERARLFRGLKKMIEDNPLLRDKLQFPVVGTSRLRTLIDQSLNWQHHLCKNPMPNHDIKTLFVDHTCDQPIAAHVIFRPVPRATIPHSLSEWIANQSLNNPAAILMGPQTPSGHMENQNGDSNNPLKRSRLSGTSQEVGNISPVPYSGQPHGRNAISLDEFPKVVVTTLAQGSRVTSMDFHPIQQTLLLVGTIGGDVFLWDVGARQMISEMGFEVWKLYACSKELQTSFNDDERASVNHVAWSPDGSLIGVAYSKNIVHIYSFDGGNGIRNHLEIEAHTGSVNHLAFSYPNEQLSVVTCGDDRLIKVWDAFTGAKRLTFEGHEAPVLSVCPDQEKNIQVLLSTATDGEIKGWSYNDVGASVTYDAPGHSSTRMAFSSDRTRMFSCGTNKEGESFLVEWKDGKGSIKRTYQGLGQRAVGIVQFDTTKNRFLAAGDESTIKIWDMNNTNLLATIHADGSLPASPCVRFNKEGTLLAVSTSNHGVRILATDNGLRLLRTAENRSLVTKVSGGGGFGSSSANAGITMADQSTSFAAMKKNEVRPRADGNPRTSNVSGEGSTRWNVTEITEPSQCYSLRLPDNVTDTKVSRVIYTNSGSGVLALASNAEHKLWKWQNSDPNLDGKATANAHPVLWKPKSGIMMINKTSDKNPEEAIPCLALSKNDSYLVSASGREISLFRMATFESMETFMPPPPAATFLAFLPSDNNIIGVGFEDSSIKVYNHRTDEVIATLHGHQNRITGLAFSPALGILVSSSADSEVCIWSIVGWGKRTSMYIATPMGNSKPKDARVQFHQNQNHLLLISDMQIDIYDAQNMGCLKTWADTTGRITSGAYSGDYESIFASFKDGVVCVFTASNLILRCRIDPAAYLPLDLSSIACPLVIAAHPSEANQFAVGLSNGKVFVVEPSETEGRWGTSSPPVSTIQFLKFL